MSQPRSEASLRAVGLGGLINVLSPVRTRFKNAVFTGLRVIFFRPRPAC
jgi:hypothetical protein